MFEIVNKVFRASRQLVQELGREPTPEEIAKRMDIPVAKDGVNADSGRTAVPDGVERLQPSLFIWNFRLSSQVPLIMYPFGDSK